jgi:hypothetical protein
MGEKRRFRDACDTGWGGEVVIQKRDRWVREVGGRREALRQEAERDQTHEEGFQGSLTQGGRGDCGSKKTSFVPGTGT